ncbi:MAG: glycosyltransferase family 39 protein [Nitrospirota bacterium]
MKRIDIALLGIIFLVAGGLRFYDITSPPNRYMDETGHVPAATNYWSNGQFEPDSWEHPPLRPILLYGFLQIFGDNPYGWRMRNVLFGSATAVLIYLFAFKISGSRKTAFMAGLLLATDPLHVVLSRHTFCEVYGTALCLLAVLLYVNHNGRTPWLMLSALIMGSALATKWNYAPVWLAVYMLALYENDNYRTIGNALFITCTYVLIPISVYILSFYQWFGRGYSFNEFIEFVANIYYSFQLYKPESYEPELVFLSHTKAVEWFIRPIVVGHGTYLGNGLGEFRLYMNNLPIWILTIPSMIGMAILAMRRRAVTLALPVMFFCGSYVLFLFIKRPAFLYSVTPLLPFVFTAIAYSIWRIAERFGSKLYYVALVVMVSWNIYLYPLVTAKQVPVSLYRYMIDNNADVKIR